MKTLVIGVDQGKKGAICLKNSDGIYQLYKMPLNKRGEIDQESIIEIITGANIDQYKHVSAVTEKQYVPKGQGHGNVIYYNEGLVNGLIAGLIGKPVHRVSAKAWQSYHGRGKSKAKSLKQASLFFGKVIKHDGIAEALLISEFWEYANIKSNWKHA